MLKVPLNPNQSINHVCCTGGAAGAVSRITGALGKGIATLTLDDAYQKQRREELNRRPADLKEGLARGGKGLVMVRLSVCRTHVFYH